LTKIVGRQYRLVTNALLAWFVCFIFFFFIFFWLHVLDLANHSAFESTLNFSYVSYWCDIE